MSKRKQRFGSREHRKPTGEAPKPRVARLLPPEPDDDWEADNGLGTPDEEQPMEQPGTS